MYKRLTEKDRNIIEFMLKKKYSVSAIAKELGKSRQCIYAEIKKGQTKQLDSELREKIIYLADLGQLKHDKAMSGTGRKKKLSSDDEILKEISYWIKEKKYSPWACNYRLANKKICTRTIYNYIYSGYIKDLSVYNLPYALPKKKKEKVDKRPFVNKGKSIEERDKKILNRDIVGHWEMDTVYSSKDDLSALLVLSERMTRKEIVIKTKDRTSDSIIKALNKIERKIGTSNFRKTFKTITCDNGVEFRDYENIEKSFRSKRKRTELYYCHPYSSCERGTNENINRMIRRFIPKGDDIGLYSDKEIIDIQNWINTYPRKILNGLSADELYNQAIQ